jgi:hypothetical protein
LQLSLGVRRLDVVYQVMSMAARASPHEVSWGLSPQEQVLRREIEAYFSNDDDLPRLPFSSPRPQPPPLFPSSSSSLSEEANDQGLSKACLEEGSSAPNLQPVFVTPRDKASIEIQALLRTCRDSILQQARAMSGISIARVMHGLASPSYPADQWGKCGFWGKYARWDFLSLAELAKGELAKFYYLKSRGQVTEG